MKFQAYSLARNKLTKFSAADLESSIQFWPKPYKAIQCHKTKLLQRFFGSSNLPFRQKKAIQYKIWSLSGSSKQIDIFCGGWFGKQHSGFSPNLPKPFSATKQNSCKDFLVQAIYLSDKRNQYNIKFEAFSAARNKLTNIGGAWFGKQHSVLAPTFHSPSVSLNKTAGKVFGSSNLPFRKKKPLKFEICTLFGSLKQIHHFLGGWFGKEHSLLAETLSSPSVSLNKTLGKVFG